MVFSSNIFLFLFLPLFLAVYYLTPNRGRLRNVVVLVGSYLFYAWWRIDFLALFAAVTAWNYIVGMQIARARAVAALGPAIAPQSIAASPAARTTDDGQPAAAALRAAKHWLVLGVVIDLAVLAYFKYANFGVASFNAMLEAAGLQPFVLSHVILPIGISFYVFESISYIADVYRGDVEATRHPVDFATFIALFPHLIAGPVFRYKDLADQFEQREHSVSLFGEGALRFMQGFIKKVFIADSIAPMVTHAFALSDPTTADAWLGALAYTVQLYFDFSGYSDMAIGLGLMMGFRFVENFNQPYVSQSITEFWRRWHMSLSSWLRDYLYISLGGNRGGTVKTYRNLFLTMLLGGLWHGANWTFVIWGAWHGAILCVERMLGVTVSRSAGAGASPAVQATEAGASRAAPPAPTSLRSGTVSGPRVQGFKVWRWAPTFLFVVLGWVMFRADHVGVAWTFYQAMFRFDGAGLSDVYASSITQLQLATMALAIIVLVVRGAAVHTPPRRPPVPAGRFSVVGLSVARWTAHALVWPLFALAVLKLSAQSYSPFLYFQF